VWGDLNTLVVAYDDPWNHLDLQQLIRRTWVWVGPDEKAHAVVISTGYTGFPGRTEAKLEPEPQPHSLLGVRKPWGRRGVRPKLCFLASNRPRNRPNSQVAVPLTVLHSEPFSSTPIR
jgi:hypothetical protein